MPPTAFDKPPSAVSPAPTTPGIHIFTMPERYRHGAHGAMHEPEKKTNTQVAQVRAPSVPSAPLAPSAPQQSKSAISKKKFSTRKLIMFGGGGIVLILAVGGYLLVNFAQQETVPASETVTPVTRPAPVSETVVEVVEEPVVEEPAVESEPFPAQVTSGVDTDSDGLTDTEETLVYRTNPRLPDTDADGFLDGNEVFHRYNPGGIAPGTLLESELVSAKTLEFDGAKIVFYYPSIWSTQMMDDELVFDTGTGEGIRVSIMAREARPLEDWAASVNPLENARLGTTKNGLTLLQSENQLTAFVDLYPNAAGVLIMDYDTGASARVEYLQTLQMMLNSVTISK